MFWRPGQRRLWGGKIAVPHLTSLRFLKFGRDSVFCLTVCLSVFLTVCLFFSLSVQLSGFLCLSVCLSVFLSVCLSVCQSLSVVQLCVVCSFIRALVWFVSLFVCPYVSLFAKSSTKIYRVVYPIKPSEFLFYFREIAEDLLFANKMASGFCGVQWAGDITSVWQITILCLLVFPASWTGLKRIIMSWLMKEVIRGGFVLNIILLKWLGCLRN